MEVETSSTSVWKSSRTSLDSTDIRPFVGVVIAACFDSVERVDEEDIVLITFYLELEDRNMVFSQITLCLNSSAERLNGCNADLK